MCGDEANRVTIPPVFFSSSGMHDHHHPSLPRWGSVSLSSIHPEGVLHMYIVDERWGWGCLMLNLLYARTPYMAPIIMPCMFERSVFVPSHGQMMTRPKDEKAEWAAFVLRRRRRRRRQLGFEGAGLRRDGHRGDESINLVWWCVR